MIDSLFNVLNMAIMDDVNASWLTKKEDMLKRNIFSGKYLFPIFTRESYPLGFIVEDANVAWDKGHYLNAHHRYVLEKLGLHSKEDIEKRNVEWLKKHEKYDLEVVKGELRDRLNELYIQIEKLQPIQKNRKILMQNGKEYDIKEPLEPDVYERYVKIFRSWMSNIPKDYGSHRWDIR